MKKGGKPKSKKIAATSPGSGSAPASFIAKVGNLFRLPYLALSLQTAKRGVNLIGNLLFICATSFFIVGLPLLRGLENHRAFESEETSRIIDERRMAGGLSFDEELPK